MMQAPATWHDGPVHCKCCLQSAARRSKGCPDLTLSHSIVPSARVAARLLLEQRDHEGNHLCLAAPNISSACAILVTQIQRVSPLAAVHTLGNLLTNVSLGRVAVSFTHTIKVRIPPDTQTAWDMAQVLGTQRHGQVLHLMPVWVISAC